MKCMMDKSTTLESFIEIGRIKKLPIWLIAVVGL